MIRSKRNHHSHILVSSLNRIRFESAIETHTKYFACSRYRVITG
ncbi:hypothetical protein RBWH47_00839 [Rhodopirellula baltica WH47]|uniref:Uncharacterized protein n=1 Tax=Rhodopirellula baltica WH47 TaxID=991778 RepID=F2AY52_RHOBT|nr:hypothetical protein RBWH47_00839 [Rhodopirellula baltica WH47]